MKYDINEEIEGDRKCHIKRNFTFLFIHPEQYMWIVEEMNLLWQPIEISGKD